MQRRLSCFVENLIAGADSDYCFGNARALDEAEVALLKSRYKVSNEERIRYTTVTTERCGALFVEHEEFRRNAMTTHSVESWRQVGDICLKDAQQPELSKRGRADAAFDACYMYARCILGAKSARPEHPDPSVLDAAAAQLRWAVLVMRPARQHLYKRYAPLRDDGHYDALLALALRLKAAASADGISAGGHR